jgi:hypothetical protein
MSSRNQTPVDFFSSLGKTKLIRWTKFRLVQASDDRRDKRRSRKANVHRGAKKRWPTAQESIQVGSHQITDHITLLDLESAFTRHQLE